MVHHLQIDRSETDKVRVTHVFATDESDNQQPHFPFIILCKKEKKKEFVQLLRDSFAAHSANFGIDVYIIQKKRSLAYNLKDVESDFLAILTETFGWEEEITRTYSETKQLNPQVDPIVSDDSLMDAVALIGNILGGHQFESEQHIDYYNKQIARTRKRK